MLLVIIAAWLAYKKAKESDRNGVKWALITAGAFLGTNILVALAISVGVGLFVGFDNIDDPSFRSYEIAINLVATAASILVAYFILRHLGKIPEDKIYVSPPPPPSSF